MVRIELKMVDDSGAKAPATSMKRALKVVQDVVATVETSSPKDDTCASGCRTCPSRCNLGDVAAELTVTGTELQLIRDRHLERVASGVNEEQLPFS